MKPGEKAELDYGNKKVKITANTDINFMAWKTREIVFENERIDVVFGTLNHVYRSKIRVVKPDIAEKKITVTFKNQELTSILKVIGQTLDLEFKETEKGIEACKKASH